MRAPLRHCFLLFAVAYTVCLSMEEVSPAACENGACEAASGDALLQKRRSMGMATLSEEEMEEEEMEVEEDEEEEEDEEATAAAAGFAAAAERAAAKQARASLGSSSTKARRCSQLYGQMPRGIVGDPRLMLVGLIAGSGLMIIIASRSSASLVRERPLLAT
eukprot:gnl/TRDRNA2_/TRDRNA2_147766_c0_seq1.p1 gnl/TRDRNA2_/TRDRNA2_147766_c0~~gnl/TRDRNA2_/TRDRNA2_147766_c0_seq1.p1  ORF type:complete len:162 (+),score=41.26 gnl/TRDRNA2_/TRDRNA2_147766_c0_seq1:57-542(+)